MSAYSRSLVVKRSPLRSPAVAAPPLAAYLTSVSVIVIVSVSRPSLSTTYAVMILTRLATGTRFVSRLPKWIVPAESMTYAALAPTVGSSAAMAGEETPTSKAITTEPIKRPIRMPIMLTEPDAPFA
ncbi:hypothetical protein GCM10020220_024330 [Nonomuraea rubra]